MKPHIKLPCTILATALAAVLQLAAIAAVPLAWDVRPGQPAPVMFDRYHGETINLTATFRGFGELPFAQDADIRLWYQTNGMGQAWWSAPATVHSNVLSATWSPALDPGADRVSLFFGAPSNAYSSAVLRLRHSPGFTPSELTLPVQRLDFAVVEIANAPYYTKSETDAKIVELSPPTSLAPATNYTDNATNDLKSAVEAELGRKRDMDDLAYESIGKDWFLTVGTGGAPIRLYEYSATQWAGASGNVQYALVLDPGRNWLFVAGATSTYITAADDTTSLSTTLGGTVYALTRGFRDSLALKSGVSAASTASTNYTDQALADFSSTGQVEYAESAGSTSYSSEAGSATRLYDSEQENSYTASDFATKTELATVEGKANAAGFDAASALRIVLGERVWFAVTNHMRTAKGVIPSLQLWEVRDSVTNLVYDSREEITNTVKALTRELHTELTNRIHDVEKTIPSKAWGNYQSDGTDNPEPGKVAIVNQPTVILTGGGTFNKYVEIGDSSIWVLTSSGPVSFGGGGTNGNYFAVLDDEGNAHFKVSKTDSFDVGAIFTDNPRTSGDALLLYICSTNRQGEAYIGPPTLSACTNLQEAVWHDETDGEIDALGTSVAWARNDAIHAWVGTVTQDRWATAMFFRAKMKQEGGTAIINTAPVRFDGGIQLGNGKYRLVPYTTGGKTYLTVEGLQ